MQPKNAAIRKRTQIAVANRIMFMWVAGVSILFGFASVATIFLIQTTLFNERVITEKNKTVSALKSNNAVIGDIEESVRALDANQALIDAKANSADKAVQVILDALPSSANSAALSASVQFKLLAIDGLEIKTLQPDLVIGVESLSSDNSVVNASNSLAGADHEITFRLTIIGTDEQLITALTNIEKSIRVIDILSIKLEKQGEDKSVLTAQARAFYEPARVVELTKKTVR